METSNSDRSVHASDGLLVVEVSFEETTNLAPS